MRGFSLFKLQFLTRLAGLLLLSVALASGAPSSDAAAAAGTKRPPLPEFQRVAPRPLLVSSARAAGISLEGIAAPNGREKLRVGDTVTLLATLTEKKKNTQWALQLKAVEPTAAERGEEKVTEYFTSSGTRLALSNAKTAVEVTVLGPFGGSGKPVTKVRRLLVEEDAISLGLWGGVAAGLKRREVQAKLPVGSPVYRINFGQKEFPAELIAKDRQIAELFEVTADDERAMMGTIPALMQFFQLIMSTPELSKMMLSVADISMWSIVTNPTSMTANIHTIPFETKFSAQQWALPGTSEVYVLPLQVLINDRPAMLCQLALVPPRPPLQTSAGLVALAAGQPDGKGPRLDVQLVSANLAETVPVAPVVGP